MTYWAYIDESEPALAGDKCVYLVAATVIAETDRAVLRERMVALKPSHLRKVHWYEEPSPRRAKLVSEIAGFEALHQVVVRYCGAGENAERRRRLCLLRLLRELDAAGVRHLAFEAREHKQNIREQHWVNDLRAARTLDPGVRVDHIAGPAEPLLWVPDVVAGAVGDQLKATSGTFWHFRTCCPYSLSSSECAVTLVQFLCRRPAGRAKVRLGRSCG